MPLRWRFRLRSSPRLLPAIEASRVRPVEAMRGAERLAKSFRPSKRNILIAVALFAAGFALSRLEAIGGLPVFGYVAGLALMFGGAFLVPTALWLACRAAARVTGRMFRAIRVEGKLASANLLGAIPRVSISVAALAVSLAMMVAISIMIGSFRETVTYWLGQTFKADIYAKPAAQTRGGLEGAISAEAVELIKADPDVAAVDAYTSEDTSYAGNPITLGAGDFRILLDYGKLYFKAPADAEARMNQAIGADAVVVSESFAILFKKEVGDWVELSTPSGPRPFQIAAIYYDYSSNRGAVVMDRSTYARHFPASLNAAPSTLSIYLRPGANEDLVKERLIEATGPRYQVIFTTSAAVRREVMRIFDSTFAITYALEVIAIAVAGLGVISTLITLILERRGEIAVLSFIGATRAQIRRMIVVEAVLIGGVSQMVGVFIGLMLSLVLIYVINVQSFGWTIQFHFPARLYHSIDAVDTGRHGAGRPLPGCPRGQGRSRALCEGRMSEEVKSHDVSSQKSFVPEADGRAIGSGGRSLRSVCLILLSCGCSNLVSRQRIRLRTTDA